MGATLYIDSQNRFRDPYNAWGVLWHFNLSWWRDIAPLRDHNHYLPVVHAQQILTMLDDHQAEFERSISSLSADQRKHLEDKVLNLRKLLYQALIFNKPINCSV